MTQRKKPLIKPEEIDLFREACRDIKPLINKNLPLTHKTPRPRTISVPKRFEENFDTPSSYCGTDEHLHFARTGLQRKILSELHRGQIAIGARLDLHKLRSTEALTRTEDFIEECQSKGIKWVLIIHGKGHYSKEGKPILKSLLNEWLQKQSAVLAFESSQPKHGGTGALYVLLKSRG